MDIDKLLAKGEWTGKELGQLYIKVMADINQQSANGGEAVPILPADKLKEMVRTLNKDGIKTFNGYLSIYKWITISQPICSGENQQAFGRYQHLHNYLITALLMEETYKYASSLPVIMTEAQLKEAKTEGIYKLLHYESGEPKKDNLAFLIIRALFYYLEHPEIVDNPINPIKEKYQKQKVSSKYIQQNYNKAVGRSYLTLPDGRRSDEMGTEEWDRAVNPELYKELEYREKHNGEADPERIKLAFDTTKKNMALFFTGASKTQILDLQKEEDIKAGRIVRTERHYYTDLPKGLTKWDIVKDPSVLMDCYPNAFSLEGDQEEHLAELEDLVTEFKEATDAITADIDKKCFELIHFPEGQAPLLPSISSIPLSEWRGCKVSWTDLYINNIYGVKDTAENPSITFNDNPKALKNGIAVIDRKNYTDPVIEFPYIYNTLESFFPESETCTSRREVIREERETLIESFYYVIAYNKLLDMIAGYYKIPDIKYFKSKDVKLLEDCINEYNTLAPFIYQRIKDNFYTDIELQKKKLKVLQDNFPLIPLEKLKVKEEALQEAHKAFKDFKAFGERAGEKDWLTKIVCRLPKEYKEL